MNVQILACAWMAFVKIIAEDINVCAIRDSWLQRTWRTALVSIAVLEMFLTFVTKAIVTWAPQTQLIIVEADRVSECLKRFTWLLNLLSLVDHSRLMDEAWMETQSADKLASNNSSCGYWIGEQLERLDTANPSRHQSGYARKQSTVLPPVSWVLTLLCSVLTFVSNVWNVPSRYPITLCYEHFPRVNEGPRLIFLFVSIFRHRRM